MAAITIAQANGLLSQGILFIQNKDDNRVTLDGKSAFSAWQHFSFAGQLEKVSESETEIRWSLMAPPEGGEDDAEALATYEAEAEAKAEALEAMNEDYPGQFIGVDASSRFDAFTDADVRENGGHLDPEPQKNAYLVMDRKDNRAILSVICSDQPEIRHIDATTCERFFVLSTWRDLEAEDYFVLNTTGIADDHDLYEEDVREMADEIAARWTHDGYTVSLHVDRWGSASAVVRQKQGVGVEDVTVYSDYRLGSTVPTTGVNWSAKGTTSLEATLAYADLMREAVRIAPTVEALMRFCDHMKSRPKPEGEAE